VTERFDDDLWRERGALIRDEQNGPLRQRDATRERDCSAHGSRRQASAAFWSISMRNRPWYSLPRSRSARAKEQVVHTDSAVLCSVRAATSRCRYSILAGTQDALRNAPCDLRSGRGLDLILPVSRHPGGFTPFG